jgi:large subunit ribosomal protein LP2
VLRAVGVEAEADKLAKLLSEVAGKDISALIEEGRGKLASLPAAGAAVAAAPAAGGGAAAAPAAKKEEKKEESEQEVGAGDGGAVGAVLSRSSEALVAGMLLQTDAAGQPAASLALHSIAFLQINARMRGPHRGDHTVS